MQSTSWFFIWQFSRVGSSSVRNLPHGASQQVYQISGDEITTALYLCQQERWDRNLKAQRASAVWEQESSLQHPAEVSAFWSCASNLTQPSAFPIRLVLRNSLIINCTASFPAASLCLITNSCKNALPSNMSNKRLSLQKPSSLLLSSCFLLAPSFKVVKRKKQLNATAMV